MIEYLFGYYLACSFIMFGLFSYFYFKGQIDKDNKEHLVMGGVLTALGPLGVLALFVVVINEEYEDKRRLKCQRILAKWKHKVIQEDSETGKWDWWNNSSLSEKRYNAMREHISCLTTDELKFLIKVKKSTFEIEKPLREAIIDEIIHREIVNG